MTNSPTICQCYVGKVLGPMSQPFPGAYIIQYMDDSLLVISKEEELQSIYDMTQDMLHEIRGLLLYLEKVQRSETVGQLLL